MKKPIILTLLIASSFVAQAQQSYSLKQARDYAIQHNYQSKNAQYDVDAAKSKIKETTAIGLPQVNSKASYNYYVKQPVQLVPAEFFGGQPGEFAEIVFGTEQNATGEITASQLIFDGSYIVGLQATKAYLQLSQNQQRQTELDVKSSVTDAYHMVLVAQKNAEILGSSLEKLKKLWKETEAMYENGFVEESEVDQMAINTKNVENSLNKANVQVEVAKKMLKFHMGLPFSTSITLTDNIEDLGVMQSDQGFFESTFDAKQTVSFAMANTNLALQTLNLKKEKSAFLPQISAFATHQQNSFGNEFNFLESSAQWFPTTLVGASVSLPIFSSGMRMQKVKQAKLEVLKAEQTLIQAKQGAELELLNAKAEYNNNVSVYKNETESLKLAERIKDKTRIKYQEGLASSFELTQSETQYLETQGRYIQATFNLLSSKNKLDKALNNY